MHSLRLHITLVILFLISSCSVPQSNVSIAAAVVSPTPFQPVAQTDSDSLYAKVVPTPEYLPSVTVAPPTPAGPNVQPDSVSVDATVPAITLPMSLDPLTGLVPADPSLLERRPLAIKVANYPRYIRPQSGLTLADNVYEYYIEGGLTRFIAVFYGNTSEWVGPVRSGRFFDENIQRMYQAFLVFKFADPRVLDYFKASDFSQFIVVPTLGSCPPFRLMPTRHIEVYNNSYFYTPDWEGCIEKNGLDNNRPVIRGAFFNELTPISDLEGTEIYTYYSDYSYNHWSYSPDTKQYYRYQETDDIHDGKPEKYEALMDNITATAVHASNVVFLFATHTFANTFDEEDEVYHIDLTGEGEAFVFRDGVGIAAQWHRTNEDQPLIITAANGSLIYMRPGITFYQVLGSRSFVDQDGGEWHFHHATP
jgi:hypothetical protein